MYRNENNLKKGGRAMKNNKILLLNKNKPHLWKRSLSNWKKILKPNKLNNSLICNNITNILIITITF